MTQIASSSSRLTSNETAPESGETADQIPVPPISSDAVNANVVPKPDAAIKQEVIDLTVPGSPGSREVIELTDSEDENQQAESGLSGKVKKEVPEITFPTNLGVIELFDSDEEDQGQQPAILKVNAKGKHMENPGVPSIDPVNPIQLNPNTEQLSMSGISFKALNEITEFLSTADERVQWQRNGLPVDDLCTENAIILKRFNRYPLIIDPSGRATEFLQNETSDRKLTITSFLDDSFVKQLESSLRFGNPILIQDAEHLDPVLNHVLNKEYQKTGGRVLIQLGKQEIDFSPAFRLFLSTRDPSAMFPPDVCSRTTFVNFTVTQSSLQTQSLNDVVKSERPDVDERRSNLIKMQGEFNIHLRGQIGRAHV